MLTADVIAVPALHGVQPMQYTGSPPTGPYHPSNDCAPTCASGSSCCTVSHFPGACFDVAECSKLNPGANVYGQTLAVRLGTGGTGGKDGAGSAKPAIVHRMNTSACWHIAKRAGGANDHVLLCLAEGPCHSTPAHSCKPMEATTSLQQIDLAAGTSVVVGRYPEGAVCEDEA